MFTVIIAEQEIIDSIQEYRLFMKPFLNEPKVAFCPWIAERESVYEAVPTLIDTVSREESWRAIIICDKTGLKQKNPFEVVTYRPPERQENEGDEAYLQRVQQGKMQSFEQAAQQPLTKLATLLCAQPLISKGLNDYQAEDAEFAHYMTLMQKKQELRDRILDGRERTFLLPQEVLCIARRTCAQEEYDLRSVWTEYSEMEYSRFYDHNLYFDKQRYLIFDLLREDHKNYTFDYLRFLYAIMLLANNEVPDASMKPNRVYSLQCENDEDALRELLRRYDAKLLRTSDLLEQKLKQMEEDGTQTLSDSDAEGAFRTGITIEVPSEEYFRPELVLSDTSKLGLSTDCPTDEAGAWGSFYHGSVKGMQKYLKMQHRALSRAAEEFHENDEVETSLVQRMNRFQVEDLRDYIADEEKSMVSTRTQGVHNAASYFNRMAQSNEQVRKEIKTRMSKKLTILIGACAIILYLIGFLPLLLTAHNDAASFTASGIFTAVCVTLFAAAGLICLLWLRSRMKKLHNGYNDIIRDFQGRVIASSRQYGKYLTHASNMMRGYSALNYYEDHEHPIVLQCRLLNKHICDIRRAREVIREVFGIFAEDAQEEDCNTIEPYDFDFARTVDYDYPLPYTKDMARGIEFMQAGNYTQIPVSFVQRVIVKREELYE